jgi:hypothetical protein
MNSHDITSCKYDGAIPLESKNGDTRLFKNGTAILIGRMEMFLMDRGVALRLKKFGHYP